LKKFVASEKLCGQNKYRCSSCRCMTDALRETQFSSLPPLLMIHLKRFSYDNGRRKVSCHVECPFDLSLDEYSTEECRGKQASYELFAIIFHRGNSSMCGHYVALIKVPKTVSLSTNSCTTNHDQSKHEHEENNNNNKSDHDEDPEFIENINSSPVNHHNNNNKSVRPAKRQAAPVDDDPIDRSSDDETDDWVPSDRRNGKANNKRSASPTSTSTETSGDVGGENGNSEWLLMDDDEVMFMCEEDARSLLVPESTSSNTAYILFYKQKEFQQ